jgi:hypothetical protein
MKMLLLGGLLSGVLNCSTLRPPAPAQVEASQQATSQQVVAGPLSIHIHDAPTIIHKNKPLVFVDGRRYSTAKLSRLHLGQLDSVPVINSATGVSLCSIKGRDSVLVIATKKGRR